MRIRLDDVNPDTNNQIYRFKDCRVLNNVSGLFYQCQGLIGVLPNYGYEENLQCFYSKDQTTNEYYYSKLNATRYTQLTGNEIPEGMFMVMNSSNQVINSPIEYAYGMFFECKSLEGLIPGNLFRKCSSLTNLAYFFYRCSKLGTLNNTEIVSRKIPYGLFDDCMALLTVQRMFSQIRYIGKSLESSTNTSVYERLYGETYCLPKYLFRYCTLLQSVSGLFARGWTSESVPDDEQNFYISSMYGTIYEYIFQYNTALTDISLVFYYCTNLTGYKTIDNAAGGIGYEFFQNNTLLTDLNHAFYGCSNVTGVEIGIILAATHEAIITNVSEAFNQVITNKSKNGKLVGKQLIYDLYTNEYLSFFDKYGIYMYPTYEY
jgi:hypothetical protein